MKNIKKELKIHLIFFKILLIITPINIQIYGETSQTKNIIIHLIIESKIIS